MKMKRIMLIAALFFFIHPVSKAQTLASTKDLVALPTTVTPSTCNFGGVLFKPNNFVVAGPPVQVGVNNTGTDICTIGTGSSLCMVMAWDHVPTLSPYSSSVYVSWDYNGAKGSLNIPNAFDPDVAVFSNASSTVLYVVYESGTNINARTYLWNGSAFALSTSAVLKHTASKTAKNPNVDCNVAGYFAVVWHEEGAANPSPTITVSYSTVPPVTYTLTAPVKESNVYIAKGKDYSILAGNIPGDEVRPAEPSTPHLLDRFFNPDVCVADRVSSGLEPISVAMLSEWFNPVTFSVTTGRLAVVQGGFDVFLNNPTTENYTVGFSGKPRIAARMKLNTSTERDYSVVMGTVSQKPCTNGVPIYTSTIQNWWKDDGVAGPAGGAFLSAPFVDKTLYEPVVTYVDNQKRYAVAFAAQNLFTNNTTLDVVANTYKSGVLTAAGQYSYVNKGDACTSAYGLSGSQTSPSIASVFDLSGTLWTAYLFWDQSKFFMGYKMVKTAVPGGGTTLRTSAHVGETSETTGFSAMPNPAQSEITFNYNVSGSTETPLEIELFNNNGQSMKIIKVSTLSKTLTTSVQKFAPGVYLAVLKTSKSVYKYQFIKN